MPNINKEIAKCKHPNSRKTIALNKHIKKQSNKKNAKLGQAIKQNLIGVKVAWFRDHLIPDVAVHTAKQTEELILTYLARFEEELEQIVIKHSIGNRKNRQHASREDIINLTKQRELEEFNTCGTEIPDIFNAKNLLVLRKWNGELRFLQNLKMRRVSRSFLQQTIAKETKKQENAKQNENDEITNKAMELE